MALPKLLKCLFQLFGYLLSKHANHETFFLCELVVDLWSNIITMFKKKRIRAINFDVLKRRHHGNNVGPLIFISPLLTGYSWQVLIKAQPILDPCRCWKLKQLRSTHVMFYIEANCCLFSMYTWQHSAITSTISLEILLGSGWNIQKPRLFLYFNQLEYRHNRKSSRPFRPF